MIYSIHEYYTNRSSSYMGNMEDELEKLNNNIDDDEYFSYEISIPRAHARMEDESRVPPDQAKAVEHYSIYITKQIGTVRNRRDCFLYCKFPSNDRLFKIILHMDGGVSYEKSEHKYMLRVTDELDRRIVLGFCKKYQGQLKTACYSNERQPNIYILKNAADYTHKMMPVRIKSGSIGNNFKYPHLEPYEESYSIFSKVAFI